MIIPSTPTKDQSKEKALEPTYETCFSHLTPMFSQFCGEQVHFQGVSEQHQLDLFYRFTRGKLYLSVYSQGYSLLGQGKFFGSFGGPVVVIHYLTLQVRGTGIGSQIVSTLLRSIGDLQFPLVILKAQSKKAAAFWAKQGFLPMPNSSSSAPVMYFSPPKNTPSPLRIE